MKRILFYTLVASFCISCQRTNKQIDQAYSVKYEKTKVSLPKENRLIETDYLKRLQIPSEYQTIDPGIDNNLTFKKGTTVFIPANCLSNEDGTPVSGEVKIEMIELYSAGDLILSNKPTISDKEILETGGSIFITAKQGNKSLKISCGEGFLIGMPSKSIQYNMGVFYGEINSKGDINWQPDTSIVVDASPILNDDSFANDLYELMPEPVRSYMFNTNRFGWINCDRFFDDPREKVDLVVKIINPIPLEYKTRMFLVFKNIKSVMPLYSENNEVYINSGIPNGEEVSIVALSASENAILFASKNIVIRKGITENVQLENVKKEFLEEKLAKL